MRKFIAVTGLILFCFTGYSQVLISLVFGDKLNSGKIEFGLDGGLSLSNLKGPDGGKNVSGLNLGFYFDIKTKNPAWMVSTGVVVKGPMGAKGLPVYSLNDDALDSAFKGGSVTTKLGYFYVPITMKYTFKNRIFLKGGIQLGLINGASDNFVNSIAEDDDLNYTLKRNNDFALLDAGLAGGIGYRLMKGHGMNLNINYYYGLIDVESDDDGPDVFNRAVYFNVGIPIGKGKAEKREAEKKK
jgi:Outer membrane protein beta-barrel domain